MSRSHWRDRTTSRHHSPSGGKEWANETVGKKLKPDGGRLRSLYPMYWSLRKKKEEKGHVQELEINALSFKNQRGWKYQIQTKKIRQSSHGMTEPNYTTYRQTDRLTDRETDRQTKSQSSRPTGRLTNEERGRETYLRTTHYLLPGRGVRGISRGLYGFQGGRKESVEIDKV